MADRKTPGLPQNSSMLNRAALRWLIEAKEERTSWYLYLLSLAAWGLKNKAQGDWPEENQYALQDQVNVMFLWPPNDFLHWLLSNPNSPYQAEQQANLLHLLQTADSPKDAAAHVLNAIYSRQAS